MLTDDHCRQRGEERDVMRERHKEKTRLEAISPNGTEGEKGGEAKKPENMFLAAPPTSASLKLA